jgi:hypothetical protein
VDATKPRPTWWCLAITCVASLAVFPPAATVPGRAAPIGAPPRNAVRPAATVLLTGAVKYYIVGPPVNGQQEYLFAIAVRTLGNGNRAEEIFNLNKGRTQPDGAALIDPAVLRPGWVLLLPPDATGPGVLTGQLPTGRVTTPTTAPNGGRASQSQSGSDYSGAAVRLAGIAAVIMVMLIAIELLRRGTRLSLRTETRRGRHPAGGALTRRAHVWLTQRALPAGSRGDREVGGYTPVKPRGSVVHHAADGARWPPDLPPPRPPAPTGARQASVDESPVASTPPSASSSPGSSPDATRADRPPPSHVMETELVAASGQDRAVVRLVGIRMPETTPAWVWLDPDLAGPPRPTYVALGADRRGALCVDLLQAPDVLTITGDDVAAQRLAASLARQLADGGVPVTVVGKAVGVRVPGAHMVRTMVDAEGATNDPVEPQVIFCSPDHNEAPTVRRLIARPTPRTILVLVGHSPQGRWSVEVRSQRR